MLDPQLLNDFMRGFYGYGNLRAKYWFIGLEEGGGKSLDEVRLRIDNWNELGRPLLADLLEFHERAGITRWSGRRPPLQSTWKQLIRVVLSGEGQSVNLETIRAHQRDLLGRPHGDTALIELMPLPSPSIGQWLYGSAGIDAISNRESYAAAILDQRITSIRSLVHQHHPPVVVFYGFKRRDVWSSIVGQELSESSDGQFGSHAADATLFVMMKHPVTWGAKNADFEAIGKFVRNSTNQPGVGKGAPATPRALLS
jgi:hypothetical protein